MISDLYLIATGGEPVGEPINLTETKEWLRVRTTADDPLITALISSAILFGEKFTNRVFIERTLEGFFSGIETSNCETTPFVTVRRAPLLAVTSVEVLSGGSYTAFTDYKVKDTGGFARILFENGIYDASPDSDEPYPLKITFTAGYGAKYDVPADIKTALLAHVAFLYENRGDVVSVGGVSMPLETQSIYSGKYQILNTFG